MRRRDVLATAGTAIAGLAGCGFLGRDTDGSSGETETDTLTPVGTASTPTMGGRADAETDVGIDEGDPFQVVLGFERELTVWTVENDAFGRTREHALRGSYSGGIETGTETRTVATAAPGVVASGARLESANVAWLELPESEGGGLLLRNAAGDPEVFVGANDPDWVVAGGSNPDSLERVGDGPVGERWVEADLAFDWGAGTAAVTVTDTETDRSASATVDLGAGRNVATVALTGFTGQRFEADDGFVADACAMYWDDIQLEG
jgi:hypothetical protein